MSTEDLTTLDGVGEGTAEKLAQAGIATIEALASCAVKRLVNIGFTKSAAMKMLNGARERCSKIFGFVTGDDLLQQFKKRQFLTSGTETLDNLIGGKGFETQKVYELYGPEGTGKSNMLLQLVCIAFLPPDKGGLGAGTIFIDTEGTFSIKRIQQLAPRFGIDPDEISGNIIKAAPPTSDVLLFLCETQLEKMAHQTGARLFCLDSIATHFRSEYGSERQGLPERQQKANKVVHALKRVAQQMNGVSILTNQVTANVTGMGRKFSHAMGNVIGHESQVRLRFEIKSTSLGLRKVTVEKAIDLPNDSCILKLTNSGFRDEDWKPPKETKKKAPVKKKGKQGKLGEEEIDQQVEEEAKAST